MWFACFHFRSSSIPFRNSFRNSYALAQVFANRKLSTALCRCKSLRMKRASIEKGRKPLHLGFVILFCFRTTSCIPSAERTSRFTRAHAYIILLTPCLCKRYWHAHAIWLFLFTSDHPASPSATASATLVYALQVLDNPKLTTALFLCKQLRRMKRTSIYTEVYWTPFTYVLDIQSLHTVKSKTAHWSHKRFVKACATTASNQSICWKLNYLRLHAYWSNCTWEQAWWAMF